MGDRPGSPSEDGSDQDSGGGEDYPDDDELPPLFKPVADIAEDTDLLILLCYHVTSNLNCIIFRYYAKSKPKKERHARDGEAEEMQKLLADLEQRKDINHRRCINGELMTPLELAVQADSLETVKCLVENGADVGTTNTNGQTLLHIAVEYGDADGSIAEIVKFLVSKGTNSNARDNDEKPPLYYAVARRQKDTCQVLLNDSKLDQKVLDEPFSDESDESGSDSSQEEQYTLLHLAVSSCSVAVVKMLLEKGAAKTIKVGEETPARMIEVLIKAGADVYARDKDKKLPLCYAVMKGNSKTSMALLHHGTYDKKVFQERHLSPEDEPDSDEESDPEDEEEALASEEQVSDHTTTDDEESSPVNKEPDKDDEEPSTGDEKPAPDDKEPAGDNKEPAQDDEEPTPYNKEPAPGEEEPASDDAEPVPDDEELAPHDEEPAPDDEEPVSHDEEPVPDDDELDHDDVSVQTDDEPVQDDEREKLTLLEYAVTKCSLDVVKELVERGADVNSKSPGKKLTPLHIAAESSWYDIEADQEEVIKFLLEKGAKASALDCDGDMPFHNAAWGEHDEACQALLEATIACQKEFFPLHVAVQRSNSVAVGLLIDGGADLGCKDADGKTAFHHACQHDDSDVAKDFIDKVEAKDEAELSMILGEKDKTGNTALHLAIKCRNTLTAEILVEKGAKVDKPNVAKNTPIHLAAEKGDSDSLQLLLKRRVKDINAGNNQQETALHKAAKSGDSDCVKLLLNKGAVVSKRDSKKKTPLEVAKKNRSEIVELLQKNLSDPANIIEAAEEEKEDVLESLLETKNLVKLINEKDDRGLTALHIASKRGSIKIVRVSLKW
ncbi:hypothetical protein BaRGS_00032107 [Batillaria attramentaria]|uniref:Ankyrin n=1 Tax=Batillaria attramentaria TaxID=370345 RepID=A0ABD0JP40_9CAEN